MFWLRLWEAISLALKLAGGRQHVIISYHHWPWTEKRNPPALAACCDPKLEASKPSRIEQSFAACAWLRAHQTSAWKGGHVSRRTACRMSVADIVPIVTWDLFPRYNDIIDSSSSYSPNGLFQAQDQVHRTVPTVCFKHKIKFITQFERSVSSTRSTYKYSQRIYPLPNRIDLFPVDAPLFLHYYSHHHNSVLPLRFMPTAKQQRSTWLATATVTAQIDSTIREQLPHGPNSDISAIPQHQHHEFTSKS